MRIYDTSLGETFVGDHRLSLMLSQTMGSQHCRDLLALQLADWNRMQTDCYLPEERLRIFALLAGKPVGYSLLSLVKHQKSCSEFYSSGVPSNVQVWHSSDSEVNVCSELDWKRCLAVHLWFMLPPTASVADALTRYETAFKVSSTLVFSTLVTFVHFSLLRYLFRVQMRKANMLVHLCLPIWKQSRWTWRKRKSVNGRCMTSAFICSNSTVTGECLCLQISLTLNVQVNQTFKINRLTQSPD